MKLSEQTQSANLHLHVVSGRFLVVTLGESNSSQSWHLETNKHSHSHLHLRETQSHQLTCMCVLWEETGQSPCKHEEILNGLYSYSTFLLLRPLKVLLGARVWATDHLISGWLTLPLKPQLPEHVAPQRQAKPLSLFCEVTVLTTVPPCCPINDSFMLNDMFLVLTANQEECSSPLSVSAFLGFS